MNPSQAIAALRAAGFSEVTIATEVHTTQSSINRIGRGEMQPNYTVGKALVDMAEGLNAPAADLDKAA